MILFSRIFFIILALFFTGYLVGSPLSAQEPVQGEIDEQAELDGNEAGGEADYAVTQHSGTDLLPFMHRRCDAAVSYSREAFLSDFFRPPVDRLH